MSEDNIKNIIKKYISGKSTLDEEKILFENADENNTSIKTISNFVHHNKIETPNNLNEKLWNSFDKKTKRKKKLGVKLFSVAASIALIMTLYINHQNKLKEIKKEALLNEAKRMFQNVTKNNSIHRILLDDDLVVVYTKIE